MYVQAARDSATVGLCCRSNHSFDIPACGRKVDQIDGVLSQCASLYDWRTIRWLSPIYRPGCRSCMCCGDGKRA